VRTTPVDEPAHNRVKPFYRYAADVDAYNRIADAVMAEAGVPAADLHAFTLTLDQPLGGDGVHFLPAAQEAQGRYVAREILRLWPDAPR
jgi:lysophospholipase L1-like esterase